MKKGFKRRAMPTQYLLWEVNINVSLVSCCHSQALAPVVKRCFLQVLANCTKIYIILEFITGGELFIKLCIAQDGTFFVDFSVAFINHHLRYWKCLVVNNMIVQIYHGRLSEVDSRRYFALCEIRKLSIVLMVIYSNFLFSLCSLKIFFLIH